MPDPLDDIFAIAAEAEQTVAPKPQLAQQAPVAPLVQGGAAPQMSRGMDPLDDVFAIAAEVEPSQLEAAPAPLPGPPSLAVQQATHNQNMRQGLHGDALRKRLELESAVDQKVYKQARVEDLTQEMAYKYGKMTPGMRLLASGFAQAFTSAQAAAARLNGESDVADQAIYQGQAIEAGSALADEREAGPDPLTLQQFSNWMKARARGATRSVTQAGMMGPAGVVGTIAGQALLAGNEAITSSKDAGVSGWDQIGYVGRAMIIEGGITALFHKMGLGGVEGKMFSKELFKNLGKNFLAESREETAIELLNAVNEFGSNVDLNATDPKTLAKRVASTIVETGMMVGAGKATGAVDHFTNREIEPAKAKEISESTTAWAEKNPAKAHALIEKGSISRKDADEIGLKRSNSAMRGAALETLKQRLNPAAQPSEPERPKINVESAEGHGLDADELAAHERYAAKLQADPKKYIDEYTAKNTDNEGRVTINADEARSFSDDYKREPSKYSAASHEGSSALAKAVWEQQLEYNEGPTVLMMAGGGGSGKSTAQEHTIKGLDPRLIYDGTMANYESSVKRVQKTLDSGRDVHIAYTHRPVDKAAAGAMTRATGPTGRVVVADRLAQDHFDAQRSVLKLAEKFKDDPRVTITFSDNSGGKNDLKEISLDEFKTKLYSDVEEVKRLTHQALQDAYEASLKTDNPVLPHVYKAFKIRKSETKGTGDQRGKEASNERPKQSALAGQADAGRVEGIEPANDGGDAGESSSRGRAPRSGGGETGGVVRVENAGRESRDRSANKSGAREVRPDVAPADDLDAIPFKELQARAKAAGVKGYVGQKRDKIVERIRAAGKPADNVEPTRAAEVQRDVSLPDSTAKQEETSAPVEKAPRGEPELGKAVAAALAGDEKITAAGLRKAAETAYDGKQGAGKFDNSDVYNGMELGVNQYIADNAKTFDPRVGVAEAKATVAKLEQILKRLPTEKNRSPEMDRLQQFSTPPHYAYVANWAANYTAGDVMLEPSAGTGGLAVFAKNAGAKVYVNELSERRRKTLEAQGFEQVLGENAEQIHNTLKGQIPAPTVVVMNPPFSKTASGMKKGGTEQDHIDAALKLLAPNGRLVAIISAPLIGADPKRFTNWLNGLNKAHAVRADIKVARGVYKGYGTTYPTRILVIDKTGPSAGKIETGFASDFNDLIDKLEGIRDERAIATKQQSAEPVVQEPATERGGRSGIPVQPAISDLGAGESDAERPEPASRSTGRSVSGVELEADKGTGIGDESRISGRPNEPDDDQTRGAGEPEQGGRGAEPDRGVSQPDETAEIEIRYDDGRLGKKKKELTESVFEPYQVSIKVKGSKPHPASTVESAAMASVSLPKIDYTPSIPKEIIKKGILSDVQLEFVAYAGAAHSKMMPANGDEPALRGGIMSGDGTGMGKARMAAGVILDNWNKGRKKAVWLSENQRLYNGAREAWEDLGQDKSKVFNFSKIKAGAPIGSADGILFATYDTLKSEEKKKSETEKPKTRLQQAIDWLGKDFDGVIVFDEAHNMGNSTEQKGKRGVKKASQKALTGVELTRLLPNARVVYLSATSATEVANLAYADRLPLWGRGTAFPNKASFIEQISSGGIAAMEFVARDLKALGAYLARRISYNDGTEKGTVKYGRLEHQLTSKQIETWNGVSEAWSIVFNNLDAALKLINGKGRTKGKALSQFYTSQLRFFDSIIIAMQTPSVITDIEQQLAEGKSAVIQLTTTGEAATGRALEKNAEEDGSLEDLDITPRDILMQYVESSFPTAQREEYIDEEGNKAQREATDSKGNIIQNAEAVAMRDALLDKLGSLSVPEAPLDMIINHFGPDQVAEITGRKRRVVRKKQEDGSEKKEVERRGEAASNAEKAAFQSGRKRILIFSDAGGTGASYHASNRIENKQQRVHYLLQPGWRADKAIQGLGRTHRTDQAHAPTYTLVTTNLKGQKRFISTIARRLSQMGAITAGQRQAASGVFSADDNLESTEASDALKLLYKDIVYGRIEGLSLQKFEEQTGLKLTDDGRLRMDLPPISQFLNRVLALKVDAQNKLFDEFDTRLKKVVEQATAEGTIDQGLETFKADKIKKLSEQVVFTHEATGAQTKYVKLSTGKRNKPLVWSQLQKVFGKDLVGYLKSKSGKVYAYEEGVDSTDPRSGEVVKRFNLIDELGESKPIARDKIDNEAYWEKLSSKQAETAWHKAVAAVPEFKERDEHLITGALLPIWDRLRGKPRVYRMITDDGEQLLGRVIPDDAIDATLSALGANVEKQDVTAAQGAELVESGKAALKLSNDWKIQRAIVGGEARIEIVGPDISYQKQLEADGVFIERINYKTRWFIPTGEQAAAVIERVTAQRPIAEVMKRSTASIKQSADESVMTETLGSMGGNLLSERTPARDDVIPDVAAAPRPEVEDRLRASHGLEKKSLLSKIKDIAADAKAKITRAQEHLPDDDYHAGANEIFRLLKTVDDVAADEESRNVAAVIDPMGPKQLAIFERYLLMKNMQEAVNNGEPLRHGFESIEEIDQYVAQLEKLVEQTPEIKEAVANREAANEELVSELQRQDLLPKDLDRKWYYHQQVRERMALNAVAGGVKAKVTKRSFQRARVKGKDLESLSEEYDYNTDFIESEVSWRTEARIELLKTQHLKKLNRIYGRKVKRGGRIPVGYEAWQPEAGNYFYRAATVPEKVVEHLQKELGAESTISAEDLRSVLVMGGPKRTYVLPSEIVAQLRALEKPKATGPFAAFLKNAMTAMKGWMTLSLGYHMRNITGDVDAVVGGAPGVLAKVPPSFNEVHDYFSGKKLALSPRMEAARDHGVLSASMEVQEIPDIKLSSAFKRFYTPTGTVADFGAIKKYSAMREGVLRYAAFQYFKEQLEAKTLKDYGGSKPEVIDALVKQMGSNVAAAKLARELLGDYGNLTVFGNWMRTYAIPFWSYQEINATRTPRLFLNAWRKKGGLTATAVYGALATARIGAMYGLFWAINNLWRRDEEEDLGEFDRANPHINLGRYSDGSVRVLRNVGALGDFMEWFGLNSLISLYPQYQSGQITMEDIARQMGKDHANKWVQGARPDLKGMTELLMGKSLFPDVFNPRTQDRFDIAGSVAGVSDDARRLRGLVTGDGSRPRPHYLDRKLFGVSDPRKNALSEMYDLRAKYLKKEGKEQPSFDGGVSAFTTMKHAAMNGDREAFLEARQIYLKGRGYDNFKDALKHVDPIGGRLSDAHEKKFEAEFLTALQRKKLKIARDYAKETEITLWKWWNDAIESDAPETKSAMEAGQLKELRAKAALLARPTPEGTLKRQEFAEETAAAKAWLKDRGVPLYKVRAALWDHLRKEVKDQKTRTAYLERLGQRMK